MRALILVGLLCLSACGSEEESATLGGTTFTSNESNRTATITTSTGTLSVADGAEAEKVEMPAFAPRYPGATIDGVMKSSTDKGNSTVINLSSDDDTIKIGEFYKKVIADNGLTLKQGMIQADAAMVSGEKDSRKVTVMAAPQDNRTGIVVTFTE